MFLVDSLPTPLASSGAESAPAVAWGYLLEGDALSLGESALLEVFCDAIARQGFLHWQGASLEKRAEYEKFLESLFAGWQGVLEVVPRAGVTDTAGAVAGRLLQARGINLHSCHSRRFWVLNENNWQDQATWQEQARVLAEKHANPLLHEVRLYCRADWLDASCPQGHDSKTSRFALPAVAVAETVPKKALAVSLNLSEAELLTLSKQGIEDPVRKTRRGPLGLSLQDLQAIKAHFDSLNRAPTDLELETLAQTWSEHCRHRIFAAPLEGTEPGAGAGGIFADFIRATTTEILHRDKDQVSDFVVSIFSDNAGAVALDESWLVSDKVETHNSPSALDPFGGALTGILGVNRDCLGFGLGAAPIANRYGFFLPEVTDSRQLYRDEQRQAPLPTAAKIVAEVVRGVGFGGNCSGIPTPQGFVRFGKAYRGKPLVFCGTVGLLPRHLPDGRPAHKKSAQAGDAIVMAGGRVGADGIHGATFSSEALSESSPATAVQLGDPFTQKKLADTLLGKLRDAGLYRSLTDNGAGGLSSSVGEMARESGGAEVWLERVPLKYAGLAPWQIWISEAQERMTLAVPQQHLGQVLKLFADHEVEATEIGVFTDDGELRICHEQEVVGALSLRFLHEAVPDKKLKLGALPELAPMETANTTTDTPSLAELGARLTQLLGMHAITSHRAVSTRYDHDVQATVFAKPLTGKGGINALVTALRPVADSPAAVALTQACLPHYGSFDGVTDKAGMRAMAGLAVESAVRQLVASGCRLGRIALQDNFCWARGEDPHQLTALLESARGLREAALALNAPFISGKDSMFNEFSGFDEAGKEVWIEPPPTLLISALGVLDDWQKFVSEDLKQAGDHLFLLGQTCANLARTHYGAGFKSRDGQSSAPPEMNLATSEPLLRLFAEATAAGELASATALGEGGLAVALARVSLGGGLGAEVCLDEYLGKHDALNGNALDLESALFAETGGRILCALAPAQCASFIARLESAGVLYSELGVVVAEPHITLSHQQENTQTETCVLPLATLATKYFSGDANHPHNNLASTPQ